MTAPRSSQEERRYKASRRHADKNDCPFCAIDAGDAQHVSEGVGLKVIRNIFPYSLWDGQRVIDHLMVIPKKHTDSLESLSAKDKIEYVDTLSRYEADGYNIYARAPQSTIKSVVHQHTHLIKLSGKTTWFVLLIRKPYVRLTATRRSR